jgi:hypothetical protein
MYVLLACSTTSAAVLWSRTAVVAAALAVTRLN